MALRLPQDDTREDKRQGIVNRRNRGDRRNPVGWCVYSKAGAPPPRVRDTIFPSGQNNNHSLSPCYRASSFSPTPSARYLIAERRVVGACNERMRALCNPRRTDRRGERAKERERKRVTHSGARHTVCVCVCVCVRSIGLEAKQCAAGVARSGERRSSLCARVPVAAVCIYTCTCSCSGRATRRAR